LRKRIAEKAKEKNIDKRGTWPWRSMRILSQKGSGGEGSIPAGGTLAERSEHRVMAGANMGPYETVGSCLDAAESTLRRARSTIERFS